MGTRGLTCVIKDGEFKVANYQQWDSYPSGQGIEVLTFIKSMDGEQFKKALDNCRFGDDKEIDKLWDDPIHQEFLTRDAGATILSLISTATDEVVLQNSIDFAQDSLFCEWAYLLDMDNRVLEVYQGFNEKPVPETNRFQLEADVKTIGDDTYYPIVLKAKFTFDDLPTGEQFCEQLDPVEDE